MDLRVGQNNTELYSTRRNQERIKTGCREKTNEIRRDGKEIEEAGGGMFKRIREVMGSERANGKRRGEK